MSKGLALSKHDFNPLAVRRKIGKVLRESEAKSTAAPLQEFSLFQGKTQREFDDLCEELEQLTNPESLFVPSHQTPEHKEYLKVKES